MTRPSRLLSVGFSVLVGSAVTTFVVGSAYPPAPSYMAPHNARTRAGGYDPDEAFERRSAVGRLLESGALTALEVDPLGTVRADVSPSFLASDIAHRRSTGALLYMWGRDQGANNPTVLFVAKGVELGTYGVQGFTWH